MSPYLSALPRRSAPEFHTQVLDSGALPLPVLGEKIRDWVWELL
jgi:uncharacterized protein (DUF885 family)